MSDDVQFPAVYRHYKGGLYLALGLVEHHDSREKLVVYYALQEQSWNARPLVGSAADPDGWTTPAAAGAPRFWAVTSPLALLDQEQFGNVAHGLARPTLGQYTPAEVDEALNLAELAYQEGDGGMLSVSEGHVTMPVGTLHRLVKYVKEGRIAC